MMQHRRSIGRLNCLRSRIGCAAVAVAGALLGASPVFAEASGIVRAGHARFTVITPTLVRMEYAGDDGFVDDRSTFAVGRDARFADYKESHEGNLTTIDTGTLQLAYTDDGKPFSAENLKATIHDGDRTIDWKPGQPNAGNLGGTARTLDTWVGARDLGEGVLSRDGWFVLDDSKTPLLTSDWVRSRPAKTNTDLYLFGYGSDYRAALRSLTTIGGPVPMPRRYVLGTWYSRYWPYSSADFRQIVEQYKEHDFPLDVIVMDMDWHRDGWTGYSWNRKLLPDAEQLLTWFHEQHLHVTLNDHPADGVQPHEDVYETFTRDMGQDPTTKPVLPFDAGDPKYLKTFYDDTHANLEKEGVDFWWLDWQQYPFTKSVGDLTNLFWLNHYYYQRTGDDGRRGQDLSRWGGWGSHRYPIQFSGDASTGWPMLAFEVPFTATAGNVGCFFWSHDIGGHMGERNEESYTRWCQFGATTAALRSHSSRNAQLDRRPWTYPKWAEDSIRISFHLRSELFPYIYSSVWQTTHDTVPLDRPMYFDHPHDEEAYRNPQQYMLGDNLLVAPIATPGVGPNRVAAQAVWFPEGQWYDLFTGERHDGNVETIVSADINSFPLFGRGGVPIPMQPYADRMAASSPETLVVRCYPGTDGQTGTYALHEDDGITTQYQAGAFATTELSCQTHGGQVTIRVAPTEGKYEGQPTQRAYVIELPATTKLTKATIDGMPVDAASISYDDATFTNHIRLDKRPIDKETVIRVDVTPADANVIRGRAIAHRAGLPVEQFDGKPLPAALATAIGKATSDDLPMLLTAAGIASVQRSETFYGYGAKPVSFVGGPSDLVDGDAVTFGIEAPAGSTQPLTLPPAKLSKTHDIPVDALEKVAAGLPIEDRYSSPHTFAELTVGGRAVRVAGPAIRLDFRDCPQDVARTAKATSNSVDDGYDAGAAIDGFVVGYPEDKHKEWPTSGHIHDAWLRLDWDKPQTIDRVWLYDRPNLTDGITAGEIEFDDGTKLPVAALPNDGQTPGVVKFPAKTVRWLKFNVKGVTPNTENTGLAEIVVLSPDQPSH